MEFVLLNTEGCHLCEEATPIVMRAAIEVGAQLFSEDIAESDHAQSYIEKYGQLIPVVLHEESDTFLCWPFDVEAVIDFMLTCFNQDVLA